MFVVGSRGQWSWGGDCRSQKNGQISRGIQRLRRGYSGCEWKDVVQVGNAQRRVYSPIARATTKFQPRTARPLDEVFHYTWIKNPSGRANSWEYVKKLTIKLSQHKGSLKNIRKKVSTNDQQIINSWIDWLQK